MLQEMSVKQLTDLLVSLKSKFENMNPTKKKDNIYSETFSETDNIILKSNAPEIEKRKWVISKILQVRIALFSEYSDRIELSVKKNDLNKAVEYMNEYISNLAMPFFGKVKPPSWIDRLRVFFNKNNVLSVYEYLEKWNVDHQDWLNQTKSEDHRINEFSRAEKYRELSFTFNMLYNLSFSKDNVPERQAFVFVDPSKIKI